MSRRLDDTDRALLRALSADGRRTLRALAKDVELSEPAVRERIQRLERDGVITGYQAAVAPESVDAATAAFIALRFGPGEEARATVDEALRREPCVLEAHQVAGDDCYLIKVRVASTGELADVLDRIRAIPPIQGTGTTIALRTIFERPLLAGGAAHGSGPAAPGN
ncbi:Lrp/AsnC family transcriptional regulator [Streptomyces sp. XD-27]|uniref:Lrp/AsnC family transcriptional regulator n=1 Tax=Streptomyces sp. XD-27 TaxID=3062779 RepID=UPI0026F41C8C|nr:Lrp/AsnC family transcriptional regulator [Streptomyces sp. XD-27]WKX72780.1 Lrp/AsnC family transcriptional regulator [Streptomyces sp. XD-27]